MPKTILAVDDSRTMREMLEAALVEMGHVVVLAEDGADGLRALETAGADVVITDFNMPKLDGAEFIEQIRRDPKYRGLPILVLTTETDPLLKERARKAGATGWIMKPFEPGKLAEAIRRVSP